MQPFILSYSDQPPSGTCQVFNNLNGSNPPITIQGPLDAGAQVTLQGPNGAKNASLSSGQLNATVSATGNYLTPGAYTVSAPGGKDVSTFSASITIPASATLTSPPLDAASPVSVTRSNGLTVTWSGSQAGYIQIEVFGATDNTFTTGADVQCNAPAAAGSFTIPPSVLLALPAGNFGQLAFRPFANPANLTGSGLNFSKLLAWSEFVTPLAFK